MEVGIKDEFAWCGMTAVLVGGVLSYQFVSFQPTDKILQIKLRNYYVHPSIERTTNARRCQSSSIIPKTKHRLDKLGRTRLDTLSVLFL